MSVFYSYRLYLLLVFMCTGFNFNMEAQSGSFPTGMGANYNRNTTFFPGESGFPPAFVIGNTGFLNICYSEAPTLLDTMLAVIDPTAEQTDTWLLIKPPNHGTATITCSAMSTGGIIIPTGLLFSPMAGYSGGDTFIVCITDGGDSSFISIYVSINQSPVHGTVSGVNIVCPGHSEPLTASAPEGIWSSERNAVCTIDSAGIATGVTPGQDTIVYTITNGCGTAIAYFPFYVDSYAVCMTGIPLPVQENSGIRIFPNPNNGVFSVQFDGPRQWDHAVLITNSAGENVAEMNVVNGSAEFKINEVPGMYLLSSDADKPGKERKIFIVR